jgi:hypothetical protein
MAVPARGGALLSSGSVCEDEYSLCCVTMEWGKSGVVPETSALWVGFVPFPWGGVWGANQDVVWPVADRCGRGRVGNALVLYDVVCLGWRSGGKKITSSGVRRQMFSMVGERMLLILS